MDLRRSPLPRKPPPRYWSESRESLYRPGDLSRGERLDSVVSYPGFRDDLFNVSQGGGEKLDLRLRTFMMLGNGPRQQPPQSLERGVSMYVRGRSEGVKGGI